MARRSSARLAARKSVTPQPLRTTEQQLEPVQEDVLMHNTPGAFPGSASPEPAKTTKLAEHIERAVTGKWVAPQTACTVIDKGDEGLYPDLSSAKETELPKMPERASSIIEAPHTAPSRPTMALDMTRSRTPSRTPQPSQQSTAYQFTFRAQSMELSNEARQMMADKRHEAASIKQSLNGTIEANRARISALSGRRPNSSKSRAGRFSGVHKAQFSKLDSIAEGAVRGGEKIRTPISHEMRHTPRTEGKVFRRPTANGVMHQVHGSAPPKTATRQPLNDQTSPSKRIKRSVADDAGTSRPIWSTSNPESPATPKHKVAHRPILQTPPRDDVASPKKTASVNVTYPALPGFSSIPVISPRKIAELSTPKAASGLLSQSPIRSVHKNGGAHVRPSTPPLARSPVRPVFHHVNADPDSVREARLPLLARSPMRLPVATLDEQHGAQSPSRLLTRSPVRAMPMNALIAGTTTPKPSMSLKERFDLLRKSPVKSILRSPIRPGLATPDRPSEILSVPRTEPVRKHVNFTASTKVEEGSKAQNKPIDIKSIAQNTFSYPDLPRLSENVAPPTSTPKKFNRRMTLGASGLGEFTFRADKEMPVSAMADTLATSARKLSIRHVSAEPASPRRETVGVFDARKRKIGDQIVHGEAIDDKENESSDRPNKRMRGNASEPRVAVSRVSQSATKRASVMPARGMNAGTVRSRPNTVSMARLNALAMPKKRAGE